MGFYSSLLFYRRKMGFVELLLLSVALAMDVFAVSICKGIGMKRFSGQPVLRLALFFGGFHAVMPLIGWLLGHSFSRYILAIDHWIAFALLILVGAKMIYESLRSSEEVTITQPHSSLKELFVLAFATTIDALAVGVALAFDEKVHIMPTITMIGVVTSLFVVLGIAIGIKFGDILKGKAEIIGGVILIGIGIKILIEHLCGA